MSCKLRAYIKYIASLYTRWHFFMFFILQHRQKTSWHCISPYVQQTKAAIQQKLILLGRHRLDRTYIPTQWTMNRYLWDNCGRGSRYKKVIEYILEIIQPRCHCPLVHVYIMYSEVAWLCNIDNNYIRGNPTNNSLLHCALQCTLYSIKQQTIENHNKMSLLVTFAGRRRRNTQTRLTR